MKTISKDTAVQISYAHREIENGEKLLSEITQAIKDKGTLDYRDTFGQRANIQLQVPTSFSSQSLSYRLFDIMPDTALAVIGAHIEQCRARLAILSAKAKAELEEGGAL